MIIIRTPPQNDNNKSRRENSGDFERIIRTEKKSDFEKIRIIRARRRRENFENNKNRDLPARRRRKFFRGILRQKRGFC